MNFQPKTYSPENPHGHLVNLRKEMRGFYYVMRDFKGYAQMESLRLIAQRQASIWELCAQLSRPLEWGGGR